jgi:histidinol phosphatase-like enzyme
MQKDNKTVCVKFRFWTNDLEVKLNGKPAIACWEGGVIIVEPNKGKGIKASSPIPFNSFDDIIPAIKEVLRKNNVLVVSSNRRGRILNAKRRAK